MALYFEDEYEKLVMEAHFDCKQPNNPIDNRLSFQCKFYKVCMTAMNTISYHKMMNQCLAYKGNDLQKMYLTWNKNETKEIIMLVLKFGKTMHLVKTNVLL